MRYHKNGNSYTWLRSRGTYGYGFTPPCPPPPCSFSPDTSTPTPPFPGERSTRSHPWRNPAEKRKTEFYGVAAYCEARCGGFVSSTKNRESARRRKLGVKSVQRKTSSGPLPPRRKGTRERSSAHLLINTVLCLNAQNQRRELT